MQASGGDPRVPEPVSKDSGLPAVLGHGPPNPEVLHNFARAMAENILRWFMNRLERAEPDEDEDDALERRRPPDLEALAGPLASAAIAAALREACASGTLEHSQNALVEPQSSSALPSPCHMHRDLGIWGEGTRAGTAPLLKGTVTERDEDVCLNADLVEIHRNREASLASFAGGDAVSGSSALYASRGSQPCHPSLSQSGLPVVGSLDYPDAPPTTPLLPELVRSRESFTRKLKGGLAKEFLPSPPPSTPKDRQNDTEELADGLQAVAVDPGVALIEHLMQSLSTVYSEEEELAWRDDFSSGIAVDSYGKHDRIGPQDRADMVAYAESLSGVIIDWVTNHYLPGLERS
ncbi:uncharacterized protein ACJ7VT_012150 [Polymixia lowei]